MHGVLAHHSGVVKVSGCLMDGGQQAATTSGKLKFQPIEGAVIWITASLEYLAQIRMWRAIRRRLEHKENL